MDDQHTNSDAAQPTPEGTPPVSTPASVRDDLATDKAVEDIVKQEGDEVLQAEDSAAEREAFVMHQSRPERFKQAWRAWWENPRKRWGTIAVAVVLVGAICAVPISRDTVLGLAFKAPVTVRVLDVQTGKPVSGAIVRLNGQKAETNASGNATLKVYLGSRKLQVGKPHYTTVEHRKLVGFGGNNFAVALRALGQQVRVKFTDKITGKALVSTAVTVGDAKAKTDKNGTATVVLPARAVGQPESVTATGYNATKITLRASGQLVQNTFALVPAGKLYFLSNRSGTIDVVKTNLDGTDRQTVLAGTGAEDQANTLLLASPDWKYLALLSRRAGDKATVYLIDTTAGDKLVTVDAGNNDYRLIGWSGDGLIYQITKGTVNDWQPGQQVLKSYNALTRQALLLDSTQGSGTSENDYVKQTYGSAYILGSEVVYGKNWMTGYTNAAALNGKQAGLYSISATGTAHRVVKVFTPASGQTMSYIGFDMQPSGPASLTVHFNDGVQDYFYDYQNSQLTTNTTLTVASYDSASRTPYLLSPSGTQSFWSEVRDGKEALLVGDKTAASGKQVASLSNYTPYGWYTDKYLLVSRNGSELYIMGAGGGSELKVSDYYKQTLVYPGYGGGYGGL